MTEEPELPLKSAFEELVEAMTHAGKIADRIGAVLIARSEYDGKTNTSLVGPQTHVFGMAELLAFDVKLMLRGDGAKATEPQP